MKHPRPPGSPPASRGTCRSLVCALLAAAPGLAWAQNSPESKPQAAATKDIEEGFEQIKVLTRAMELVRQNYADEARVSYPKLIAAALRGMMAELDPHCQYISRDSHEEIKQAGESNTEGTGLTIAPRPDGIAIISVREDGPAAAAGILPGDQILKLGAVHTSQVTYLDSVRLLKGRPGEPITLTTWRSGTRETKELTLIREALREETIRDAMLLPPALSGSNKLGYLRLIEFNGPTATELADALDRLENEGMQALILDLRNNPGGLLSATVEALGEFLPANTVVATTEGRSASQNPPPYKTPARKRRERTYPLIVLVNHGSASGAELMAGALQDLGRATILGTTTFGKGSVQSIIPGEDGTAVRLTTARYFTPKHRLIHGLGITPDILAPSSPEEEKRLMEFYRDQSKPNRDLLLIAKLGDSQLERAATALQGALTWRKK